jgi:hypothetical protein
MFDLMTHKLNWLKRNVSNGLVTSLGGQLEQLISDSCRHHSLPHAVQTTLELELLYCCMRNRPWLTTGIFKEIVVDQTVCSFGLANETVDAIVTRFLDFYFEVVPPRTDHPSDIQFLRYLIISKSSGQEPFCRTTGFSQALFEKIDANQKLILEELDDPDNTRAHFLSHIDQLICSEIIEVCEMEPRDIDQCVLISELNRSEADLPAALDKIYNFLFELCRVGSIRNPSDELAPTISLLSDVDLIQTHRAVVEPTSSAFQCTARGFAEYFWNTPETEFFSLPEVHSTHQRSIVRNVPLTRIQEMAERIRPILPKLTPSIYLDLAEAIPEELALPLLTDIAASGSSDWHRHFACQALQRLGREQSEVRQILSKVAQSDDSELVKDTALEQLARSAIGGPVNGNPDA